RRRPAMFTVMTAQVGPDGVLTLPLSKGEANKNVRVLVEVLDSNSSPAERAPRWSETADLLAVRPSCLPPMTQEEWAAHLRKRSSWRALFPRFRSMIRPPKRTP